MDGAADGAVAATAAAAAKAAAQLRLPLLAHRPCLNGNGDASMQRCAVAVRPTRAGGERTDKSCAAALAQ
jgi:hypothetical protein